MFKKEEPKKGPGAAKLPVSQASASLDKGKGKDMDMKSDVKAYFDAGIKLEGKLIFEGTARIDGQVTGEIYSKDTVIIGEKALIEAQVEVNTIIISGNVQGNIKAKHLIHLKKTAQVIGDLDTPSLIIEEGGIFEGGCKMAGAKPATPPASNKPDSK